MVDWELARRVAALTGGAHPPPGAGPVGPSEDRLRGVVQDATHRVVDYTGMTPDGPLPAGEVVQRREWVQANLDSMGPIMERAIEGVAEGMGPLTFPMRTAAGLVASVQIGALAGYMSQRVLGQYEMPMLDPAGPTRLLFVGANVQRAAGELDAEASDLLDWVAFHEVTHAVQFAAVRWLREHMAALVGELLASVRVSVDPASLLRLPTGGELRELVEAVRSGDLITFLAGGERRELIDRLQATMAMIEGHAEHVMDAVGAETLPSLSRMRTAMNRRRRVRPPLHRLLERLLGLEMKMRQYELGKSFCDEVVAREGVASLHRAWAAPEALPTLPELSAPDDWLERMRLSAAA